MHDERPRNAAGGPNTGPAGTDDDARLDAETRALREHWLAEAPAEPPAPLDQAVLNAARRAVRPRRPWPFRIGWPAGLATAAVAVLAVSVLLLELAPPAPPAPPAETNGFRLEQAPQATPDAAGLQDRATAKSAARPAAAAAARELSPAPAAAADAPLAPDQWITRLLELQRAGDLAALAQELERFRAAYPDYPLPDELAE